MDGSSSEPVDLISSLFLWLGELWVIVIIITFLTYVVGGHSYCFEILQTVLQTDVTEIHWYSELLEWFLLLLSHRTGIARKAELWLKRVGSQLTVSLTNHVKGDCSCCLSGEPESSQNRHWSKDGLKPTQQRE